MLLPTFVAVDYSIKHWIAMELQKAIPLFQVSFLKGFMLICPGLRVRRGRLSTLKIIYFI